MAAMILFTAYWDIVVDPSLFIVNKKNLFYPEMDKFLTDTDRNDFVKWTLIVLF